MIEFFNIKPSSGGGDGSSLNIFAQLEEPSIKKGIWLKAQIPYYFYQGSVVAIGTDIYLLGGSGTARNNNYKYNTLTDTYTQLTSIPYEFIYGSAVAIGTDIYLLCGHSDYGYFYKYNTLTDTYTQLTNVPYAAKGTSAVAIGTDIYILGGYSTNTYSGLNYCYKYDTLTDTWTRLSNIPYNFAYGSAISIGTNIYLIGGSYSQQKNYKYDTLTNTYTQLTNVPINFEHGSGVSAGTDIYIFYDSSSYKYNTLTDTYTQLTNIPNRFTSGGGVVIGTFIYLMGTGISPYNIVQVYALESKTYTQNTVVISQGKFSNVGYEIELFSNTKDTTPPLYAFADAWFYGQSLETNIPTYYGDGTQWINLKNPPQN